MIERPPLPSPSLAPRPRAASPWLLALLVACGGSGSVAGLSGDAAPPEDAPSADASPPANAAKDGGPHEAAAPALDATLSGETDATPSDDGASENPDATVPPEGGPNDAASSTDANDAAPSAIDGETDATPSDDAGIPDANVWLDAASADASWPPSDGACSIPASAWTSLPPDIPGPPETPPTATTLTVVPLVASALAYDATSGLLYATTPALVGITGNSLVTVNPWTGAQGTPVFIGSDPTAVAVSYDGHYRYVGLAGSQQIQRYDAVLQKLDISFPMGPPAGSWSLEVLGLFPLASSPHSIIAQVGVNSENVNPQTLVVFDDGVPRAAQVTSAMVGRPDMLGQPLLASGSDALWIVPEQEFGSVHYACQNDAGVFLANTLPFPGGWQNPNAFGGGELTSAEGDVFDARSMMRLGSYNLNAYGYPMHVVDEGLGRIVFLVGINDSTGGFASEALLTFDRATRSLVSRVDFTPLTGAWPAAVVRFGEYGFAIQYFTNSVGEIDLVRSPSLKRHP